MEVKAYAKQLYYYFLGPESFDILHGRSKATMLLIINNAGQVILSSFFFKYAGKVK